jgi:hypothetical protein
MILTAVLVTGVAVAAAFLSGDSQLIATVAWLPAALVAILYGRRSEESGCGSLFGRRRP